MICIKSEKKVPITDKKGRVFLLSLLIIPQTMNYSITFL